MKRKHTSVCPAARRLFAAALAVLFLFPLASAARADAAYRRAGDVDGDGTVSAADARLALRCAVGLCYAADEIYQYLDADGDGAIGAADARLILRCAVGLQKQEELHGFRDPGHYHGDRIAWYDKITVRSVSLPENGTLSLQDEHIRRGDTQYRWASSNPDAASVTEDGTVQGLKKGFACVYLTNGCNRYYYFVTVLTPLQEKIYALQEKYPAGYYWNAHEKSKKYPAVSEIPCDDHASYTYAYCIGQCAGFASLLSHEVFGYDAPMIRITDKDEIKIGDYLRCQPSHSVFVIDRVEAGEICGYDIYAEENELAEETVLTVAECNWDCHCGIAWGRKIPFSRLALAENAYVYSYSRY